MIVCLGTTPAVARTMVFERVTIDAVNRAKEVIASAAGKSVNVARTLHTLGQPAIATGFVGGDMGRYIQHELNQISLRHDFVLVQASTRVVVTAIDRTAGTATELIEESKPVEPYDWVELHRKVQTLIEHGSAIVMSGTLAPGGPKDFYQRCVMMAATVHRPSIVDATGEPLKLALQAKPTIVKLNRAELASTMEMKVESDNEMKAAASAMVKAGATWVVVTSGKQPTWITDGVNFWKVETPSVKVVSTIGSGDSFAAGLAAGVTNHQSVPDACALGTACAAANAMGFPAGHAKRADIETLIKQIRVEKI